MREAPEAARGSRVDLLYLAGVVQGLALVTFPAASAIFTSSTGFKLSSAQYGAMFVPQVAAAILASALAPELAVRIGLRGALMAGLCGDLMSMALLAASSLLIGSPAAFVVLCVATGALGLGFGATVMALNTLVEGMSPGRVDKAVLALNALLGAGTALAPLLVAIFSGLGAWWAQPLILAVLLAALLLVFAGAGASLDCVPAGAAAARKAIPARFWLYAGAALLYGIVETLCGNWATLYLSTERRASPWSASLALSAFWAMVTFGRIALVLLDRRLPPKRVYLVLPALLVVVFQVIAFAPNAPAGVLAFAAAGLACSALLPLSISFGGEEFPDRAAAMSGEMLAFYQIGFGVAAFGVGPLHDMGGAPFSSLYSAGSLVALALAVIAWRVTRRSARRGP